MKIFHLASAFLIMAVLCSLLSSLAGVTVRYSREPVVEMEGRPVSFKCRVEYRLEECDVDAKWAYVENDAVSVPITNPKRYVIIVNETENGEQRHRDIVMIFKSLIIQDKGYYQCYAKCLDTGIAGKGHVVFLNVTADPYKGLKGSGWSGKSKTDVATLVLSTMLFLWYY